MKKYKVFFITVREDGTATISYNEVEDSGGESNVRGETFLNYQNAFETAKVLGAKFIAEQKYYRGIEAKKRRDYDAPRSAGLAKGNETKTP